MFAGFISTLGGAARHTVRKSEERKRCGRARRRRGRRLRIEPLEGRRLLAAELPDGTFAGGGQPAMDFGTSGAAATSVVLSGGNLVIEDTALGGKNDALTLSLSGPNVRIVDPGNGLAAGDGMTQVDAQTVDVPLASITGSIQINAWGGDDKLTVNGAIGKPVVFDGGAGGNDVLAITGSGLTATYAPDAAVTGQGLIALGGGSTITFTGLEPVDYDVVGGTFTLMLPGADDLVEIAASTLTDGTTPALKISGSSGGTAFENARVCGSAITIDTTTVAGDDTITIVSANNAHTNPSLTINTGTGADAVNVSGAASFSGAVSLTTVNVSSSAAGTITTGAGLTVNNSGAASTLAGAVAGAGGLVKAGGGTLILSSASNGYTGGTTVSAGTLKVGVAGAVPNRPVTVHGIFDLNGISEDIGDLAGSGTVTNTGATAATLSVGLNNADGNFSGVIQDGASVLALTKKGSGTQRLSGSSPNTFSGVTTVNNGTLLLGKSSGNAIGGNLTIGEGAASGGHSWVQLGASQQIPDTSIVTFAPPSTFHFSYLKLMGFNETVGGIWDTSGRGVIENTQNESGYGNGTLTIQNFADSNFNGFLRNTGSGSGLLAVVKLGSGTLTYSGENISYSGGTTIGGGVLALGTGSDYFKSVVTYGRVAFSAGSTGTFRIGDNEVTIGGLTTDAVTPGTPVVENGSANPHTLYVRTGDSDTFAGVLRDGGTGALALWKGGEGTLTLGGGAANTLTGDTTVLNGTLALSKSSGHAIGGNLNIGRYEDSVHKFVQLEASDQIPDTSVVTFASPLYRFSYLLLQGHTETVGAIVDADGRGYIGNSHTGSTNYGNGTLTVQNAGAVSFLGVLRDKHPDGTSTGTLSLVKRGGGTLTLSGDSTYGGSTTVADGTLALAYAGSNNNISRSATIDVAAGKTLDVTGLGSGGGAGRLDLAAGQTLQGTGTVTGQLRTLAGSSVQPNGPAPGILHVNNGGNAALTLWAGTFEVQVNGSTPGSGHDQLNVTGTVDVTGATFTAGGTIAAAPAQEIVLINNDGTDGVVGTFAGREEGSTVRINGVAFALSYQGGSGGNDVTLTPLGDLVLTGSGDADAFELRSETAGGVDYIEYYVGGVRKGRWQSSDVDSITIHGGGGNDSLLVNYTGSGGFFATDITFHGESDSGAPGDRLTITGGTFVNVQHLFDNGHAGRIDLDETGDHVPDARITYTGLEPVTQTGNLNNLTLTLSSVNDAAVLEDNRDGSLNPTPSDGQSQLRTTSGTAETYTFSNPSGTLTINLGDGDDQLTVAADFSSGPTAGQFDASLTVNGGTGNDTVDLNADLAFAGGNHLDVDLTDGAAAGDVDSISVGAAANLILSGAGTATLKASRNVALASGSSVEVVDGSLTVEANQRAAPTAGNFVGVDVGGLLHSSGTGVVTVKGKGGDDSSGSSANTGVNVTDSGAVSGTNAATVTVTGTGGAGDSDAVVAGGPISAASGDILIAGVKNGSGLGADVVVDAPVTASAGGDIEIRSDRHVTGGAGGDISSDGTASDGNITITADEDSADGPNGAGTIQLAGNISAGDGAVTFRLTDCDGWVGATAGDLVNGNVTAANIVLNDGSEQGVLRLQGGANTFSGTTTVVEGTLLVNGVLTGPAVIVEDGGVLGGDGDGSSTGLITADVTVQADGTLDPGDVIGCSPVPGKLTVTGNVVIEQDGYLRVQLNGLTLGTGYDQLAVNGTVDLSGTVNGVDGSFLTGTATALPFGAELRIIDNDQADSIDTRFDGLEEGDFVTTFGQLMNISYRAGTGNDVVLATPGRFDFDGYHGDTAQNYIGVSPFDAYTGSGDNSGWDVTAPDPASLPPQYFERQYTAVPPCTAVPEPELRLDGQSTDSSGTPLRFLLDVEAGKTYEVLILTGDVYWNHDRQQFTVFDTAVYDPNNSATYSRQVVDTWGAGAPGGGGVTVASGGGAVTTCPTYYRWVRMTVTVGGSLGTIGQIGMEMQDNGGTDGAAVILGMDVRPLATVGQIALERIDSRGSGADDTDPFDELPGDGVTIDSYQGTGAPPYSTITITVSAAAPDSTVHYARVTTDADPSMFGTQVTADSSGLFTFSVQRPSTLADTGAATENWMVLAEERSGLSRGTAAQIYGKPAAEALRFDFGIYGSPVQTYTVGAMTKEFLPVIPQTTYNATRGYGWTSRVAGAWRKNSGLSNLRTDLNYARDATFRVDLPNGDYSVRIYHSNPKYYGTVPYIADNFSVYAEGTLRYNVADIPAGTSDIRTFSVDVVGGALELRFQDLGGRDGNFVVSGIDISAAGLPGESPLLAAGDPQDSGAAAISVDQLQPVVSEAAARWTAAGLTAEQTARLAHVQYAVADLGGAVLGLANPATNVVRIDDDAAMMGWSVVSGHSSVVSGHSSFEGELLKSDKGPMTTDGMDLLTVVMHELGHLLGYGHSADGLMSPVLGVKYEVRSGKDEMAETRFDSSSFALGPSSFLPDLASRMSHPASHRDDVFAELGGDGALLTAATVRPSEEATQAKVPRRSRLQRHERVLDAWFAELAAEEAGNR